jgi:hypothetical protein
MSFGLKMDLSFGLSRIAEAVQQAILQSFNPAWESNFTLNLDSNGWSQLTPSETSRIIYFSSVNGNDVTAETYDTSQITGDLRNPTNTIKPYSTWDAAYAQMREGEDDYLFIEAGSVILITATIEPKSGKSATQRSFVTRYGTGADPILEHRITDGDAILVNFNGSFTGLSSYTAFQFIEFDHPRKNPNHVDFVGYDGVTPLDAPMLKFNLDVSDVLIEGCTGYYFRQATSSFASDSSTYPRGIVIRRNKFGYNYHTVAATGHSQGINLSTGEYLIEDNIIIYGGWNPDHVSDQNDMLYWHGMYVRSVQDTIIRYNTIVRPSSIGIKMTTSNYYVLDTALTSATETSVVVDFIPDDAPATGTITIELDSGAILPVEYTSWSGSTYTIVSTDFSSDNASLGKDVQNNYVQSENVAVYHNAIIDAEVGLGLSGNEFKAENDLAARFDNWNIIENLSSELGSSAHSGRNVAYGIDHADTQNTTVAYNISQAANNPSLSNLLAVKIFGYVDNVDAHHNLTSGLGASQYAPFINSYANIDNPSTGFVDTTRTALTYLTSIGETATVDNLITLLEAKDHDDWREDLSALSFIRYVRIGWRLSSNYLVISDVLDETVNLSDIAQFTYDVYANDDVVATWYKDDVEVSGETDPNLIFTPIEADDGADYYATITINGQTLTSSTALLTVDAPRIYLTAGASTSSYTTFTQKVVGWGDSVSFSYNTTSATARLLGSYGTFAERISLNGEQFRITVGGTSIYFSVAGVYDGNDHDVTFAISAGGVPTITFDGTEYAENSSTVLTTEELTLDATHIAGTGTSGDSVIWDLSFNIDGTITEWAVDSGSTTTEAASIGTGTMTFVNVSAGDWA